MTTPDRRVTDRLRQVLVTQEHQIPADMGFEGTGAPGLYVAHLLGLTASNADIPDPSGWKVKYSSGNSLVTLFHKDAYPRGDAIRYMINRWGWIGRNGRQSFRHTICGESDRFTVVDEASEIRVRRTGYDDLVPHWPHDVLIDAFSRKLRNLILVHGRKRGRTVWYDSAEFFSEARSDSLIRAIRTGTICIDFDAFIRESGAIRNHGTKFRAKSEDIAPLYTQRQPLRVR